MPQIRETRNGLPGVPQHQLHAVISNGEHRADLTAAALDGMGLGKPSGLPLGFLLELSAVVELGVWERLGLRAYLHSELPTFQEAAAQLAARAAKGLAEFYGQKGTPISDRVLEVWLEAFAWEGREILGAEIVLGDANEDQFADLLAEFLWNHRHELSKLAPAEEEES